MRAPKRRRIAFERIARVALAHCDTILAQWLPGGRMRSGEYLARNPKRADNRLGSFSISTKTGHWADFATGDSGGDLISLAAYLFDLSQAEAATRLARMLGESLYESE
jgi:hypothetical protein